MVGGWVLSTTVQESLAPAPVDYDTDDDNLIEISNLAQLNAMRWDLDGDGAPSTGNEASYAAAFPDAVEDKGCLTTCIGYELTADLNFDTSGNGVAGPDLTGAPGDSVTLQGVTSINTYGEWWQLAHQWTQLSGPTVTLTHPQTFQPAANLGDPRLTIPADAADGATLEFRLTVTDKEGESDSDSMTVTVVAPPPPRAESQVEPELTPITSCLTDPGSLTGAAELSGAWDDADCRAHHRADSPARHVHFTVSEEAEVSVTLTPESGGALFVSKGTSQNGWGTPPRATYEHRVNVRLENGKLLHNGDAQVTLTLAPGETYTVEAVSTSGGGSFTLSIGPTEE